MGRLRRTFLLAGQLIFVGMPREVEVLFISYRTRTRPIAQVSELMIYKVTPSPIAKVSELPIYLYPRAGGDYFLSIYAQPDPYRTGGT